MACELMWSSVPLGELCDQDRGITYGIVKVGDFIPGGVPVIRGGDIRDGRIVFDDSKRVSQEVSDQFRRTVLRGGEIVLNLIAEPGHSAIVPHDFAGFNVSRDVAVIPLLQIIDHRFVDYFLKSKQGIDWLKARLQGSVTQKINLGTLRELPIPTPPLPEQKAIAEILGALDDKIELNRRMNATLEGLARALFKSWFVDFDPVRAKMDGRPPEGMDAETAALFPDGFEESELGPVPRGWKVRSIEEIAKKIAMGPFGSRITRDNFVDSGIPVIRGANLTDGFNETGFVFLTEEKADDLSSANVTHGDIVFTHRGTLGQVGYIPEESNHDRYVVSQSQMFLRVNVDCVSPRFVYQFFRSPIGQHALLANTSQTGVPAIARPTTSLKSIRLAIPQKTISDCFDQFASNVQSSLQQKSNESQKLVAIRDALLPKLLSGEISVAGAAKEVEAVV